MSALSKLIAAGVTALAIIACASNSRTAAPNQTPAAQASSRVPLNKIGFYHPGENVPYGVRKARRSVFMIVVPSGAPVALSEVFGGLSVDAALASVEQTPVSKQVGRGPKDLMRYQLQLCARQPKPLECKIYRENRQSSAFLFTDGFHLRIAFHGMKDWAQQNMSLAKNNGADVTLPIPAFIYEVTGRLVSSPAAGVQSVTFAAASVAAAGQARPFTPPSDDLAILKLPHLIGVPLKPASIAAQIGDRVYILGYPRKTSDRAGFGGDDSPGRQLLVSGGQIISEDVAARTQGLDVTDLSDSARALFKQMTLSDADIVEGDSGGPLLNAAGEVLGSATAGYPADGAASARHVAYSSVH